MPKIYRQNCKKCKIYYEGFGKLFCSHGCQPGNTKPRNDDIKQKYRLAKLGTHRSEETKRKISRNNAHYWLDKKQSEESKKKNSETQKGEKAWAYKDGRATGENLKLYRRHQVILRRARKRNAEGTHTLQEWEELKKLYGFMCLCCKLVEPEIKLTEDHIIPLTKGGSNSIENIQPLCGICNSRKWAKVIDYRLNKIYATTV